MADDNYFKVLKSVIEKSSQSTSDLTSELNKLSKAFDDVSKSNVDRYLKNAEIGLKAYGNRVTDASKKILKMGVVYRKETQEILDNTAKLSKEHHKLSKIMNKDFKDISDTLKDLSTDFSLKGAPKKLENALVNVASKMESFGHIEGFSKISKDIDVLAGKLLNVSDSEQVKDLAAEFQSITDQILPQMNMALDNSTKELQGQAEKLEAINRASRDRISLEESSKNVQKENLAYIDKVTDDIFKLRQRGAVIDESMVKTDEIEKEVRRLSDIMVDMEKDVADASIKTGVEKQKALNDVYQKYTSLISEVSGEINRLRNVSENYQNSAEAFTVEYEQTAQRISDKFYKWSQWLKKIEGQGNRLGGVFKGLGGVLDKVSERLQGLALPLTAMAGMYGLLKTVAAVDKEVAGMYKGLQETGLFIGASAENVGGKMESSLKQAHNVLNLVHRAASDTVQEFSLNREEIVGIAGSLDKAGMAARNLDAQMKNVSTTASSANNALLGAASLVKTFSMSLAVSDNDMSSMIGNMAYEFNSSMGRVKDIFTGITSAAQQSGMSTSRFLGIVDTATSGMSFFDDQIESTAQLVGLLGSKTTLTGKQISTLAKSSAEFASDYDKVGRSLTILGSGGMKELGETAGKHLKGLKSKRGKVTQELNVLQAKGESATPAERARITVLQKQAAMLNNQVGIQERLAGHLKKGEGLQAGALMEFADSKTKMEVLMKLASKANDMSGENARYFRDIATTLGVSSEMQGLMLSRGGKLDKEVLSQLEGQVDQKSFEQLQKEAIAQDVKTGAASAKAMTATADYAKQMIADWSPIFNKMLMSLMALNAVMIGGKLFKGLNVLGKTSIGQKLGGARGLAKGAGAAYGGYAVMEAAVKGLRLLTVSEQERAKILDAIKAKDAAYLLAHPGEAFIGLGDAIADLTKDIFGLSDASKEEEKIVKSINEAHKQRLADIDASGMSASEKKEAKALLNEITALRKEQADERTDMGTAWGAVKELTSFLPGVNSGEEEVLGLGNQASALDQRLASMMKGGRAHGGSIPATGMYKLHRGEEVVPASHTPTAAKAAAANAARGSGNVNVTININGGDLNRVRSVVKEEIYNAKNRAGYA